MQRIIAGAAAVAAAVLMSCGIAGSEFDVTRRVSVHASADDRRCQEDQFKIDLSQDKAFQDVRAVINRIELRKLSVSIANPKTDPSSAATEASGSLRVGATADAQELVLSTYGNVPVEAGSHKDIDYEPGAADMMLNLVKTSPSIFYLRSMGCADTVPAYFDFDINFRLYAGL